MLAENINHKALNDTYKNAHIALQSISDILPDVNDEGLKEELKTEYEGYENFMSELNAYMEENDITRKDINFFKKAMLWSSIKMKTLIDDSRNQIADMMLNGTVMGINELTAMKNEGKNFDPKVTEFIQKLLSLEEDYEKRLRKFL